MACLVLTFTITTVNSKIKNNSEKTSLHTLKLNNKSETDLMHEQNTCTCLNVPERTIKKVGCFVIKLRAHIVHEK